MYIGLFVQLHGLPNDTDPEEIVRLIRGHLNEEFQPDSASDILVDVEEMA